MTFSKIISSSRYRFISNFLINVVFPVFVGGAVYTLWRSKHLLVFAWYRAVGLTKFIDFSRTKASGLKGAMPLSVLNSLPDALWVYAFTSLMLLIWSGNTRSPERKVWIGLPVTMAIIAEFGQMFRLVPGTFDWNDLVAYIIAFLSAYLALNGLHKSRRRMA